MVRGKWEGGGEGGRVAMEGPIGRMNFNYRMCDLIVFMANPLQMFPTCSVLKCAHGNRSTDS